MWISSRSSKSSDKDQKKKSSSKKDKDKDKDRKKDKKKDRKKDEEADELLASLTKAMAPNPRAKVFDPLGSMGGGGPKKFDPLGSGAGLGDSSLLGPGLGTRPSPSGLPSDAAENKSMVGSEWAGAPEGTGKSNVPTIQADPVGKNFNVLDAAKLIQSSGVRHFVETQNSGYNQLRKPGKPSFGPKKDGIADLSILSEESLSGHSGSSPEPGSPPGGNVASDACKPVAHSAPVPAAGTFQDLGGSSQILGSAFLGGGKFGNLAFASDLLAESPPAPSPEPDTAVVSAPGSTRGSEGHNSKPGGKQKPASVAVDGEVSSGAMLQCRCVEALRTHALLQRFHPSRASTATLSLHIQPRPARHSSPLARVPRASHS